MEASIRAYRTIVTHEGPETHADPGDPAQALLNAALDQFAIPGDASFPLNQAFEAPRDRQDAETMRQYGPSNFPCVTEPAYDSEDTFHKCDKNWRCDY